jgi:hypothetical protein
MKVYFHKFWGGFFDKTNPVYVDFFLELFTKVFDEPCEIGCLEESDILCETVYEESAFYTKPWKRTVLFSGESERTHVNKSLYTFVLCGERNHGSIVNCPPFVPFLWCREHSAKQDLIGSPVKEVPPQSVVAIISNPCGDVRNSLLDTMEAAGIQIVHAGSYRNNTGFTLPGIYCDDGFIEFIRSFKFIISMENSVGETYVTEKICSGFLAGIIPIYWGCPRVGDYFNKDRFIQMDPANQGEAIQVIKDLDTNPAKWLSMVNEPVFTGGSHWRTMDDLVRDCKAVLYPCPLFPNVRQIYFLCKKEFEPQRYASLTNTIQRLGIPEHMVKFLAPTWGTLLTTDTYSHHVQHRLNDLLPWWHGPESIPFAALSVILNFRALFEDITKRYAPTEMIVTFESDVIPIYDCIFNLPRFLNFCASPSVKERWGCIHFGYGTKCRDDDGREIVADDGEFSLINHTNTRCMDSFLWQGSCVEKLLDYMKETEDYSEPIDHYVSRFFETRYPRHCWSSHVFFKQSSTYLEYPAGTTLCPKHRADCTAAGEVLLRQGGQWQD